MGASILWQPVKGKSITPGARSDFVAALVLSSAGRVFGPDDIRFLQGVAAAREDFREACNTLIDAILQHEEVRVWAEY